MPSSGWPDAHLLGRRDRLHGRGQLRAPPAAGRRLPAEGRRADDGGGSKVTRSCSAPASPTPNWMRPQLSELSAGPRPGVAHGRALRRSATPARLGGNLGTASPAGDTLPVLAALDGRIVSASSSKARAP